MWSSLFLLLFKSSKSYSVSIQFPTLILIQTWGRWCTKVSWKIVFRAGFGWVLYNDPWWPGVVWVIAQTVGFSEALDLERGIHLIEHLSSKLVFLKIKGWCANFEATPRHHSEVMCQSSEFSANETVAEAYQRLYWSEPVRWSGADLQVYAHHI